MKKIISSIIPIILTSLIGSALLSWRELGIAQSQIEDIKYNEHSIRSDIKDIHWYLIESKGVKITRQKE